MIKNLTKLKQAIKSYNYNFPIKTKIMNNNNNNLKNLFL